MRRRNWTERHEGNGDNQTQLPPPPPTPPPPPPQPPPQNTAKGGCWSTLLNVGKWVLLITLVIPFLNYSSLKLEGQMLVPKEGQVVDVGSGQTMHLTCKGQGHPMVLLDAPTGMSSDIWFHIQESISQLTKVCTYDRVGLGFSRRALLLSQDASTDKVWGTSTTGRMVDDLHQLVQAAGLATPFILVGSELGTLNARFYSHIHHAHVSDMVLIDPIPEDVFEEEQWQEYWYSTKVPSHQVRQLCAAMGLSRLLIILGLLQPHITGDSVPETLTQRQKYLLSNPAHQSSAVDEHYFLNESASQVRDISKFKPLSSTTSVTVITGDSFDEQMPAHLNQLVAKLQTDFLERCYPSANHIHAEGADRRMIYKRPSVISEHLRQLISQRQSRQQSQ